LNDPASNQALFGIHGVALELRGQRMGVLTSNIANAATPGYKARDIDFAAALKARLNGASTTQATQASTLYRVPVMPSLDGNTVDMGTEQVAFSQNASAYAATLSFISDGVGEIRRALKGGE
jgi:flagellar basal-body rod protein FlgB